LPADAWALERTISFQAQDDQAIRWQGLPGFTTGNLRAFFWMPLPAHLLASLEAEQVAAAPAAAQTPPGWGAYRLVSWEPGKALHLEKNPYYFAADSGLPAFDLLDFLIIPDVNQAVQMLSTGECDLLDYSYRLENLDKAALESLAQTADLHIEFLESFEQLVFGIIPAAYDDGYSVWAGDRPDYFGDLRVRQAVAACLQPTALANAVLSEKLLAELLPQWQDWTAGLDAEALLDQAGWIDADGDPTTPRLAQGVNGVHDTTPLSLNLVTGKAELDQQIGALITARLGDCGIEVHWQSLPTAELYAPGPEGVLFGRQFDLALLSWQTGGLDPCRLYLSKAVPSADNAWIGTNLAGWADPAFDLACGEKQMRLDPHEAQDAWELLKATLPAVPLLPPPVVWASSLDVVIPEGATWQQIEQIIAIEPAQQY
jgi:peptide/nickel transport system substrate-binding protein